jgi:hypothetical protein
LALVHPLTRTPLRFEAPLPQDMRRYAEDTLALPPDRL